MSGPLRGLGPPPDAAAWTALLGAVVVLWFMVRRPPWETVVAKRYAALALSVAAGVLSLGYVAYYLGGGPRIIDATSYWLEAQSLARGHVAFDVPGPSGSFRGRFLLTAPGSDRLVVLFPPGYPLILALGCVLGVPMLVGPALGALIAWATFVLAEKLWGRRDAACAAALFSVLSATLRYHTADTMSHGWAALLLVVVVLSASSSGRFGLMWAGLAAGGLLATRPVTGAVGLVVLAAGVWRHRSIVGVALVAAALLPGLALLAWHQHAATGSLWGSSHLRYYALADGPEGCFRYGFGKGIGCLYEHGGFVREYLPRGHGFLQGVAATTRRLRLHLIDVGNLELLALALPFAAWRARRTALGRMASVAVLGVILGYAPFYFDGNYPGGGARLFADVLPVEHALLGGFLVHLRLVAPAVLASLVGFACHASFEHRSLAAREGGHPMFDARLLESHSGQTTVLFVDTDHGFNLGHRPWQPGDPVVVARYGGDAHDAELLTRVGVGRAVRYSYDPRSGQQDVRAYVPPTGAPFEAECDWPPLEVTQGWVERQHSGAGCLSGGRGLALHPRDGRRMTATLELYVGAEGRYRLETRWAVVSKSPLSREASVSLSGEMWQVPPGSSGCFSHRGPPIALGPGRSRLLIEVEQEGWVLDAYRAVPER